MYTSLDRLICIPAARPLRFRLTRRSSPDSVARTVALSQAQCVWFLLWWLFLHPRLRSGQRGADESARLAAQRLIISLKCHPFLSGRSGASADSALAGLSAAAPG